MPEETYSKVKREMAENTNVLFIVQKISICRAYYHQSGLAFEFSTFSVWQY